VSVATNVHFDGVDVDLAAGQLFKRGVRIRLRETSFQVLASLVEHTGQVETREDFQRRLWPDDVFVDLEHHLSTALVWLLWSARLRSWAAVRAIRVNPPPVQQGGGVMIASRQQVSTVLRWVLIGVSVFLMVSSAGAVGAGPERACQSWTPAMIGGPVSHKPHELTIRWLGTSNVELTYRGQVILLSAFFDPRVPGLRDIGITADQVVRADAMFFGHEHFDHTRNGATIATRTGARVFGNLATYNLLAGAGVPATQLNLVNSGDVYHFTGFTVQPFRMLHSQVGQLAEDYWGRTPVFWATAYGALAPWYSGFMKQQQALNLNQPPPPMTCPPPPPLTCPPVPPVPATMPSSGPVDYAYLFTFDDDFRFIYYDSMNWLIEDEAELFMQQIGGSVDVATSGYSGFGSQIAVPYALPAIKLFNPRYWFPGHHDALPPAIDDQPLLPMFYQIRKDVPDTEPVFLEMKQPLCFDVKKHVKLDRDGK
jgi:hypothetical protein